MNNHDIDKLRQSTTLSDIVRQYVPGIKQSGQEFVALCPFHNERTPSFFINDIKAVYYCQGCGAKGDVFNFIMEKEGLDFMAAVNRIQDNVGARTPTKPLEGNHHVKSIIPIPTKEDNHNFENTPDHIHRYTDEQGNLLYKIARYEASGERKKYFLPATHTKDGWLSKAPTEGRVLYNLAALSKHPTGLVILVAGERKCDQLQAVMTGNAVVSWCGGDGAFKKTDQTPLSNRRVVFWPDNDDGCKELIHQINAEKLWMLPPPEGMPAKWDCGDAIEAGWDLGTVGSHMANKVLYERENHQEIDLIRGEPVEVEVAEEFPSELLNAPGLIGRISAWIVETSIYPRPVLALAAAIAGCGVILGHNVRSPSDLRTNMYVLGMATSGAGKNYPRVCVKRLLIAAGIRDCFSGAPVSGAAVLTAAAKNRGKGIIFWDEFGLNMGNISGKNASPHQQQISQMLMELFTSANDTFIGSEYSNRDGKSPRIDIEQPCLSIFATTVKSTFFAAMTSKQSLSGFIPRWLMLDDRSTYRLSREDITDTSPPEALVEEVKRWNGTVGVYTAREGVSPLDMGVSQFDITPITIKFSFESKVMLRNFEQEIVNMQNNESIASEVGQDAFCAIWARAREYAIKLALCGHEGDEITASVTKWAIDLVKYSLTQTIKEISVLVSDNEQEAFAKKILDIIRKSQRRGISKSQLTRKTQWVNGHTRESIIADLEQSGQVVGVIVVGRFQNTSVFYMVDFAPKDSSE